ncbi:MAG: helix-turn-helix domain-containing protein, partial [Candidatus Bathyarchaeota archaeon]|nr:helix-turn-helix domain-containing protein [Candidatus Bathyarchaeum sp.]
SKDVDIFVKQSFEIVDRIHEILTKQGKEQKDLAKALGKTESEISKWMTGTHNFTINTLAKIQAALGEPILQVAKEKPVQMNVYVVTHAGYAFKPRGEASIVSPAMKISQIRKTAHGAVGCLN